MTQPCAIETCKRASRTLCHCCNQNLCRDHFNEHDDLLNSQLHPLTDEINELGNRFTSLNRNKIIGDYRQKLDRWRIDCYRKIDHFYEQKCEEFDQYIAESFEKQLNDIINLRSKMTEAIDKREATKTDIISFTSAIDTLEEKMDEIEHISNQIDIKPLVIDYHVVQMNKPRPYQFNLLTLSSPYKKIKRHVGSWNAITSNDRFLLVHIAPNLCLVNRDLLIIKQVNWNHGLINEMCWSSVLGSFFVMTCYGVFLVNENTMSIDFVEEIGEKNCWSGTCSNKSLYLSEFNWNSTVFEFTLLPSIQLVQHLKTTDTIKQQQLVDSIMYSHETLCLITNDKLCETKRIELRSSKTFNQLWSLRLDTDYDTTRIRGCLLNFNEWLLVDWSTSRFLHIINDGKDQKISTYESVPYCANLFGSNIFAILTDGYINFHKL